MPLFDCHAPRSMPALIAAIRRGEETIAVEADMLRELVALAADVANFDRNEGFPWRAAAGDPVEALLRGCERRSQGR
jgi:hypothetical protein